MFRVNKVIIILISAPILLIISGHLSIDSGRAQAAGFQEISSQPSWLGAVQQSTLVSSDAETLGEFGWTVAISGNTAVVGARDEDPDLGGGPLEDAGAAYIFIRSGDAWITEGKLVAKDAQPGDTFGASVAIHGNTVVVGATGAESDEESDAGAAYVFIREGITWKQKARLEADDPFKEDTFGTSVAIEGDTILVGASGKDFLPVIDSGAVYVFILRGSSWDQKAKITPNDPSLGGNFGRSTAISGNRFVVGAIEANPVGPRGPGAAYVYQGKGNRWVQEARLSAEDSRGGDFFGQSVAINRNTIVVGAIFKDPDLGNGRITNAGTAYVFTPQGGKWEQQTVLMADDASTFAEFGQSVSIDGDKIIVGADGKDQAGYLDVGAAYIFIRNGKEWRQSSKILADYLYEGDSFGHSVAISGDKVIVGAHGRDPGSVSSAGEAFVYRLVPIELPSTGFAPGRNTLLAPQPPSRSYEQMDELWLEIPSLGVKSSIVGVPRVGIGWDTSWLGSQAGYLEGTAFPTWQGNTGIAGHIYLPNGAPGPFAELQRLKWGDQILIHAWGQRYTYEVRQISQVQPDDLSVLNHEAYDWLTLITCQDFDEETGSFSMRKVVRAVMISKEDE